ncbi:NUDIX domain-containing protein [Riemerella anatipestifer]|uniref:NUDIX hydrolase n=1 Tax=Riemerella anatipestifer TaxID=34085 RepID=UPI001AD620C7|nr:NUDIX domain-containing protein [Riemerella anatipestifer]MBO4233616.1 NUDIX domain-containing protein [Riemerella anatipestifer]
MALKYCPKCGKETLVFTDLRKFSCNECSFVLYHNCAAAVAVLITYGDEILFTRRNQDPKKGMLDLPGGFCDPKETAENTCKRELYEELKFNIDSNKLRYLSSQDNIYHYKGIDYNTMDLFFQYELTEKPKLELELNEVNEVIWINKNDLNLDNLAFDSQKRFFSEVNILDNILQ